MEPAAIAVADDFAFYVYASYGVTALMLAALAFSIVRARRIAYRRLNTLQQEQVDETKA